MSTNNVSHPGLRYDNQYRYVLKGPRDLVKETIQSHELVITDHEPIVAKTLFSTISKGTELSAWKGLPPIRAGIKKYPRLMGYCNLAQIVEVDCKKTSFRVGDLILTGREHCTAFRTSDDKIFLKVSPGEFADYEVFSGLYLAHIAYDSLQSADYRPGHNVAIIGLGVLGYLAASLVKQFGGIPVCYTSRPAISEHIEIPGIRLASKDSESIGFGEEKFDIVINTSDSWDDYKLSLVLARKGGKIVNLGFPGRGQKTPFWNPLEPRFLYTKQLTIVYSGYTPDLECEPIDIRFSKKRNLKYLANLVKSGNNFLDFIYKDSASAAELQGVYSRLESIKDFGTVMLKWKD